MNRTAPWFLAMSSVAGICCGSSKTASVITKAEPDAPHADVLPQHKDDQHKDEPEHEELPSRVKLSSDVVKAVGIKTAVVGLSTLPDTIDLSGELAVDPDRSAIITARAAGRIIDVRFKEGDRVKANDLLAVVQSAELAHSRAQYTSAQARAEVARTNADRLAALAPKGLASGQEVDLARSEAIALAADVAAARQGLAAYGAGPGTGDASTLELRSPIDGYVLRRNAVRGQAVAPEVEIAAIVRLDHAYFLGRLFEKDLAGILLGGKAEVRLNAYPKEVFTAAVESVGKQVDPLARTVLARIDVADHDELLKAGLFGTARVILNRAANETPRITVPLSAVTEIAGKNVVFVLHPDGDFELHPLTLGRTAGGNVEVLTGIRVGENVVVDGVFTLKSTVLKATFGEED